MLVGCRPPFGKPGTQETDLPSSTLGDLERRCRPEAGEAGLRLAGPNQEEYPARWRISGQRVSRRYLTETPNEDCRCATTVGPAIMRCRPAVDHSGWAPGKPPTGRHVSLEPATRDETGEGSPVKISKARTPSSVMARYGNALGRAGRPRGVGAATSSVRTWTHEPPSRHQTTPDSLGPPTWGSDRHLRKVSA